MSPRGVGLSTMANFSSNPNETRACPTLACLCWSWVHWCSGTILTLPSCVLLVLVGQGLSGSDAFRWRARAFLLFAYYWRRIHALAQPGHHFLATAFLMVPPTLFGKLNMEVEERAKKQNSLTSFILAMIQVLGKGATDQTTDLGRP